MQSWLVALMENYGNTNSEDIAKRTGIQAAPFPRPRGKKRGKAQVRKASREIKQ